MKVLQTKIFSKLAKSKYPKSETEPYNPWAVCNKSTGGKKEDPDKFERCVHHLKDQNKEKNKKKEADIDDMKDVRRHVFYRRDKVQPDEFQGLIDDEMSGKAQESREQEFDDVWLDALQKMKSKVVREPALAFVIELKNK